MYSSVRPFVAAAHALIRDHAPPAGVFVAVDLAKEVLLQTCTTLENREHEAAFILAKLREAVDHMTNPWSLYTLAKACLIVFDLGRSRDTWEPEYLRSALMVRESFALHISTATTSVNEFEQVMYAAFGRDSLEPNLYSQLFLSRSHIVSIGLGRKVFDATARSVLPDVPSAKLQILWEACELFAFRNPDLRNAKGKTGLLKINARCWSHRRLCLHPCANL